MSFGYAFLSGRRGAEGYVRQDGEKRRVLIRGLMANEACALYALSRDGALLCCRGKANGEGRAELLADRPGNLFLEAGGEARLWEGDDAVYLRASAFLSSRVPVPKEEKRENREEAENTAAASMPAQLDALEAELEEAPVSDEKAQKNPRDDPPAGIETEMTYTLRPSGGGEPVDALPDWE